MNKAQEAVLARAAALADHEMLYSTRYHTPNKIVQSCLLAGWLEDAGYGIAADGDGYALQPEREVPCYRITEAGRRALDPSRVPGTPPHDDMLPAHGPYGPVLTMVLNTLLKALPPSGTPLNIEQLEADLLGLTHGREPEKPR
jgi:hypothetical protein